MEYIDGEDLAGVLRLLGRPSREKAIEIARQICLGLAAAHENKVLHRDLKPANIMIDGRGRVRITDFGLAGFLDELEHTETRAGTPAYMAPEQLTDGKVSVRSDIYSLGLILYELFTGKGVFDTNDIEELKRKHTSGTVSTPSSISEEIDPAVERFKELDQDDAEEFRSLLQTFRNLYSFLSQVIPYQDSDLEKLYTYARFLLSKLPRRRSGPMPPATRTPPVDASW